MKVQGTMKIVDAIQILGNKVLVRNNIVRQSRINEQGETEECWEYDEVVYKKDDYIKKLNGDVEILENQVLDIMGV